MYSYATFVDAGGAARIGWAWVFFRSYYSHVWKQGLPLFLLASTVPAYSCVWYMMGVAIYSAATSDNMGGARFWFFFFKNKNRV